MQKARGCALGAEETADETADVAEETAEEIAEAAEETVEEPAEAAAEDAEDTDREEATAVETVGPAMASDTAEDAEDTDPEEATAVETVGPAMASDIFAKILYDLSDSPSLLSSLHFLLRKSSLFWSAARSANIFRCLACMVLVVVLSLLLLSTRRFGKQPSGFESSVSDGRGVISPKRLRTNA